MAIDPLMPSPEPETERRNERSATIDQRSALDIVRLMNDEDATVAAAVRKELPQIAQAIEAIADRLRQGGRLIYIGAGTSGRLGVLDASECPPTFSTPPDLVIGRIAGGDRALRHSIENAEDSEELGRAEIEDLQVTPTDAVVGIAASGRTPYVLAAMEAAKARGALTIGLACNAESPLEARVEIMIAPVVGPEVIAGSTRLKAGTAQKMVLNMLSTGTMILLGKTYGNLMVDFNPSNTKLRRRAVRIVEAATGLPEVEAGELLRRSDNETKVAIVAALAGVEPDAARRRLIAARGIVRQAVEGGAA
jgi:N-acetylmuramic acid 6-phosphate etherase